MQTVQVVLFVVVAALALTLIGYLIRPRFIKRRAPIHDPAPSPPSPPAAAATALEPVRAPAPASPAGLVCPACRREYALGLKYCPHDARALVPVGDPAASRAGAGGMSCPVCKRSFENNKKFCPYDAEELAPAALTLAGVRSGVALPRVLGKICPHCAQRYESDATFCGRDGSELVSVN